MNNNDIIYYAKLIKKSNFPIDISKILKEEQIQEASVKKSNINCECNKNDRKSEQENSNYILIK